MHRPLRPSSGPALYRGKAIGVVTSWPVRISPLYRIVSAEPAGQPVVLCTRNFLPGFCQALPSRHATVESERNRSRAGAGPLNMQILLVECADRPGLVHG